ncbi:unnamed protein product [Cylindrotheca closterium]|uniref:EF-hand domain-containing protein n=1 Tax=Cylindrotheca closterium TaxID=2856 RepID=A0AAD2GCC6_9STRA|nr:unnamed protein product [Cylindrotheca closterium]
MKGSIATRTIFYFAAAAAATHGAMFLGASALLIPDHQTASSGSSNSHPSRATVRVQQSSTFADSSYYFPQHRQREVATRPQSMELVDQVRHDAEVSFSIFDVNGRGSISLEEFSNHLVKRIGYGASFVNQLFEGMDANHDGSISHSEFRTLYLAVPSLWTLPGIGQEEVEESLVCAQQTRIQ